MTTPQFHRAATSGRGQPATSQVIGFDGPSYGHDEVLVINAERNDTSGVSTQPEDPGAPDSWTLSRHLPSARPDRTQALKR